MAIDSIVFSILLRLMNGAAFGAFIDEDRSAHRSVFKARFLPYDLNDEQTDSICLVRFPRRTLLRHQALSDQRLGLTWFANSLTGPKVLAKRFWNGGNPEIEKLKFNSEL